MQAYNDDIERKKVEAKIKRERRLAEKDEDTIVNKEEDDSATPKKL